MREQKPEVRIGLADVPGAALFSWFTEGKLAGEGSSITEGIGVNRITGNLEGLTVDHPYRIEDAEFLPILFDLVKHEGLSLGPSSGVNIAGAIRMARDLGPGKTIVTVLCDAGQRYSSKVYDPAFLTARGLPTPEWLNR
ncbi:Cysteine synthase [compost metagenome]